MLLFLLFIFLFIQVTSLQYDRQSVSSLHKTSEQQSILLPETESENLVKHSTISSDLKETFSKENSDNNISLNLFSSKNSSISDSILPLESANTEAFVCDESIEEVDSNNLTVIQDQDIPSLSSDILATDPCVVKQTLGETTHNQIDTFQNNNLVTSRTNKNSFLNTPFIPKNTLIHQDSLSSVEKPYSHSSTEVNNLTSNIISTENKPSNELLYFCTNLNKMDRNLEDIEIKNECLDNFHSDTHSLENNVINNEKNINKDVQINTKIDSQNNINKDFDSKCSLNIFSKSVMNVFIEQYKCDSSSGLKADPVDTDFKTESILNCKESETPKNLGNININGDPKQSNVKQKLHSEDKCDNDNKDRSNYKKTYSSSRRYECSKCYKRSKIKRANIGVQCRRDKTIDKYVKRGSPDSTICMGPKIDYQIKHFSLPRPLPYLQPGLEHLKYGRFIRIETYANGGATLVHMYQDEIECLNKDQMEELADEYFKVFF